MAGWDLLELAPPLAAVWVDNYDHPLLEASLAFPEVFPSDPDLENGLYVYDLDGDGRAEIVEGLANDEHYWQRIWWNNTD